MALQTETLTILVAGRGSPLSKIQVQEVQNEIAEKAPHVKLMPIWVDTKGDKDRKTSLRTLEKTDFFTKEIDEMQLRGLCRIGVHSAKDLPEPLKPGLVLAALTKGLDSSDSLVFREGESLQTLKPGARIATSSMRREKNIHALRPDLVCIDIRGNIETRLQQLDEGYVDGLIVAECALIRLGLSHRNRMTIPGEIAVGQGQLAVIARADDQEMLELFKLIDSR